MHSDNLTPDPPSSDDTMPDAALDPAALKGALGRTGKMLKTAGLPFEADEFGDEDADETSSSSAG